MEVFDPMTGLMVERLVCADDPNAATEKCIANSGATNCEIADIYDMEAKMWVEKKVCDIPDQRMFDADACTTCKILSLTDHGTNKIVNKLVCDYDSDSSHVPDEHSLDAFDIDNLFWNDAKEANNSLQAHHDRKCELCSKVGLLL